MLLQSEECGFTAACPSLPAMVTCGKALEETPAMAIEAVAAYLESLQIDDELDCESGVVEPSPFLETVRECSAR
jgi:predicted RNase H-like HicB family nuclease